MNINDHERNIEHLAWLDPKLTILSPGTEDGSECYNYCRPTDDPFQVKVIPRFDVEVPIEIISIIPDTVSLVDGNAKLVSKTSSGKAQSPAPKQPERNAIGTMMLDFQKDETAISGGDEAGTSANDSDIQPNVLSRMGTFLRMRRILTDNKTRT